MILKIKRLNDGKYKRNYGWGTENQARVFKRVSDAKSHLNYQRKYSSTAFEGMDLILEKYILTYNGSETL